MIVKPRNSSSPQQDYGFQTGVYPLTYLGVLRLCDMFVNIV